MRNDDKPLELVEWLDHSHNLDTQTDRTVGEWVQKLGVECRFSQTGYVIHEDETMVWLAMRKRHDTDLTEAEYSLIQRILKVAIVSRTRFLIAPEATTTATQAELRAFYDDRPILRSG